MAAHITPTDQNIQLSDITTNDVSTSKHGFVPKAPNDTHKYLRGDASWALPNLRMRIATTFETSGRFTLNTGGTGSNTFGTSGVVIATGATSGSFAQTRISFNVGSPLIFTNSPVWSCSITPTLVASLTMDAFFGVGNVTVAGTGHTWTVNHIGFKIVNTGGTAQLFATQANGTTETASSALTNVANNDILDLIFVVNGSSSVDYYWRLNGGSLSSATNLSSNVPTANGTSVLDASISNDSTANSASINVTSMSYER
jgi:hypothetical protein